MQPKTAFPSSHQLKSYVAPKSRLRFVARCPVGSFWPSCLVYVVLYRVAIVLEKVVKNPGIQHLIFQNPVCGS